MGETPINNTASITAEIHRNALAKSQVQNGKPMNYKAITVHCKLLQRIKSHCSLRYRGF